MPETGSAKQLTVLISRRVEFYIPDSNVEELVAEITLDITEASPDIGDIFTVNQTGEKFKVKNQPQSNGVSVKVVCYVPS